VSNQLQHFIRISQEQPTGHQSQEATTMHHSKYDTDAKLMNQYDDLDVVGEGKPQQAFTPMNIRLAGTHTFG
jgi:hypothetical protein